MADTHGAVAARNFVRSKALRDSQRFLKYAHTDGHGHIEIMEEFEEGAWHTRIVHVDPDAKDDFGAIRVEPYYTAFLTYAELRANKQAHERGRTEPARNPVLTETHTPPYIDVTEALEFAGRNIERSAVWISYFVLPQSSGGVNASFADLDYATVRRSFVDTSARSVRDVYPPPDGDENIDSSEMTFSGGKEVTIMGHNGDNDFNECAVVSVCTLDDRGYGFVKRCVSVTLVVIEMKPTGAPIDVHAFDEPPAKRHKTGSMSFKPTHNSEELAWILGKGSGRNALTFLTENDRLRLSQVSHAVQTESKKNYCYDLVGTDGANVPRYGIPYHCIKYARRIFRQIAYYLIMSMRVIGQHVTVLTGTPTSSIRVVLIDRSGDTLSVSWGVGQPFRYRTFTLTPEDIWRGINRLTAPLLSIHSVVIAWNSSASLGLLTRKVLPPAYEKDVSTPPLHLQWWRAAQTGATSGQWGLVAQRRQKRRTNTSVCVVL